MPYYTETNQKIGASNAEYMQLVDKKTYKTPGVGLQGFADFYIKKCKNKCVCDSHFESVIFTVSISLQSFVKNDYLIHIN